MNQTQVKELKELISMYPVEAKQLLAMVLHNTPTEKKDVELLSLLKQIRVSDRDIEISLCTQG